MAEVNVENMEENADLFVEKMGKMDGGGDMRSVMDEILGHGGPKLDY
jgi:hypothetical protein